MSLNIHAKSLEEMQVGIRRLLKAAQGFDIWYNETGPIHNPIFTVFDQFGNKCVVQFYRPEQFEMVFEVFADSMRAVKYGPAPS